MAIAKPPRMKATTNSAVEELCGSRGPPATGKLAGVTPKVAEGLTVGPATVPVAVTTTVGVGESLTEGVGDGV
jgi:hypothetical protein